MSTRQDKRPSELSGKELAENRLEAWNDDHQWRDRHVDFDTYLEYYEGDPSKTDNNPRVETDDDGFPRINLTQRSIDDSVYFVTRNLPKARLKASKTHLQSGLDPLERDLRLTNIQVTEDTMNSLVDTILQDNRYRDKVESAILDAGVYGIGYLFTSIDQDMSVLKSKEVRGLLEKAKKGENWTEQDAKRYKQLSQRPSIEYHDARNVVMMAGVRRFDSPRMLRCSTIEYFRTESLKERYSHAENSEHISPGGPSQYVDAEGQPNMSGVDTDYTSLLTTWQIETFPETVRVPGTNTMAEFLNARMVRTKVAGNVLVEKKTWESTDGHMRLPVVPFQFRTSRRHPYGRSEAKSLIQSEKLVNRVRAMMYKSGLNSIRPDGVSVFVQNLAPGDADELQKSFEEGGPAFITGNMVGNEVSDIREIVMPHTFASSPLDPALRQMMNVEMEAFRFNSAKGSDEAVDQARTGRGKRAQISFNDRPKNFSVMHITGSVKRLYENIYEIIQEVFKDNKMPAEVGDMNGRREVKLNDRVKLPNMPVLNEDGTRRTDPNLKSKENPDGMVSQDLEFVLNSTNFDMEAHVENRADLPFDIPSRHQVIRRLEKDRYLSHEFARELILSDELRLRDNMHRQKRSSSANKQLAQRLRGRASGAPQQRPENTQEQQGEGQSPEEEAQAESQSQLPQEVIDRVREEVAN